MNRWRIHNPHRYPTVWYVFTTENDARTALLALRAAGHFWELDPLLSTSSDKS